MSEETYQVLGTRTGLDSAPFFAAVSRIRDARKKPALLPPSLPRLSSEQITLSSSSCRSSSST